MRSRSRTARTARATSATAPAFPDGNPVFEPDEDGDCEKHESDIETTPSGNEVMVPCHAADDEEDDTEASDLEAEDEEDGPRPTKTTSKPTTKSSSAWRSGC